MYCISDNYTLYIRTYILFAFKNFSQQNRVNILFYWNNITI